MAVSWYVVCLFVCLFVCLELTPEQLEYQQLARKFGREVIKPAAAKYDKSGEVGVMYGHIVNECCL